MHTILLLSTLVGCSESPPADDPVADWLACETTECRARALPPAWEHDRDRLVEGLLQLAPLDQQSGVWAIATLDISYLPTLCPRLEVGGAARQDCERLRERPHLATAPPTTQVPAVPRSGKGPGSATPTAPQVPAPRWPVSPPATVEALREGCDADCLVERARAAAAEGDAEAAGLACFAAFREEEGGYDACLVDSALAMAGAKRWEAFGSALVLCGAARRDVARCHEAVLVASLPAAPPADAPGEPELEAITQADAAVRAAVGETLASEWSGLVWALWTAAAYRSAESVTGHLFAALPPEAVPHLRVAAAGALLGRALPATPAEAVTALQEALAVRGDPVATTARTEPVSLREGPRLWEQDLGEAEASLPALWVLGPDRRTLAEDERVDLTLAVLEAAARLPTPAPFAFFRAALDPAEPEVVRWTAARLAGTLYPEQLKAAALQDASPLVAQRLVPPPPRGVPVTGAEPRARTRRKPISSNRNKPADHGGQP